MIRRPKLVVVLAAIAFVAAGAYGGSVADRLASYGDEDPASESVRATERYGKASGEDASVGIIALIRLPGDVSDPASRRRVAEVERVLRREPAVARTETFYETRSAAMVSRDRRSTWVSGRFRFNADEDAAAERLEEAFAGRRDVVIGGSEIAEAQVGEQVEKDLQRAEMLAFPFLFLLSLLFFRSVVAALLPLLVGGLSIVFTFVGLRLANEAFDVSIFALNLTTGLGLGLAIDYSLFMVSRFREELAEGAGRDQAIRRTMATAGRTVLYSSLTVAAALAALLVFPQRFLYSMGLGGSMVALIAAVVALVVLPAVLYLLGDRVNALAPKRLRRAAEREARPAQEGAWYRLSRFVMRRPGRIALATATLLIVMGIPFLGIRFTTVDATVLPADHSARVVNDALARDFPSDTSSPLTVVTSSADAPAIARAARSLENVQAVSPPQRLDDATSAVEVVPRTAALSEETKELVRDLRELPAGQVRGQAAHFIDLQASLGAHLPLALGIVVLATLLVLFLMTGSIVLPLKALVMNVLTLSAAFGLLVLIFQDGRFEGLLDYTSQGALEQTQPILLFAVAFGLSTDYGVFLLSRIKEARDNGMSNRESVAVGLERTGRIVSAAALLFSVAIGAFATSEIIFIKQVGLGTAFAVLLDATLIRALLVPSLMELLGEWNWWAPRPLARLHGRLGLKEA